MANVEIKQLVNYNRFSENETKLLMTIVYLPMGVILLLLRCMLFLVLLVLGQVLPDSGHVQSFLTNLRCLCFGIIVSIENNKRKENVEVFVSNSLSIFDHLAVSKAVGKLLPLNKTPFRNLPGVGVKDLGSISDSDALKKTIDSVAKERKAPIFMCPEETTTNGKGLLKFHSKYFKFFQKVQPLCITIKRPMLNISISTVSSSHISDILYFMFSPFTCYNIKFLASVEKKSVSDEEFADVIRQNIASELKVEASRFSSADLMEWKKRYLDEERRRNQERNFTASPENRLPNPEIARMAGQVKEVLPHVPLTTIYNDLAVTRSVDATITNILEGRVRFVPEPVSSSTLTPSTSGQISSASSRNYRSPEATPSATQSHSGVVFSFGKNANERTKSFQERKEQLIAAARRRYIEKHNLDIPL